MRQCAGKMERDLGKAESEAKIEVVDANKAQVKQQRLILLRQKSFRPTLGFTMIALGQKLMIFISLYSLAHYSPSLPYGCDGGSVILERVILYDLHSSDFILQHPPPPSSSQQNPSPRTPFI